MRRAVGEDTGTKCEEYSDGEDNIGAAGLQHNVETGSIFVASGDTFMRLRSGPRDPLVVFRAAERYDDDS